MAKTRVSSLLLAFVVLFGFWRPLVAADDAKDIAASSRAFSKAYVGGDSATIEELYTPDAILLPPGREVRGAENIAKYFAPRANRTNLSHAMESSELRIQGNLAIDIGTWRNTWRVGDSPEQSASGRYLVVWRRCTDGQWRIQYDMWHRPSS